MSLFAPHCHYSGKPFTQFSSSTSPTSPVLEDFLNFPFCILHNRSFLSLVSIRRTMISIKTATAFFKLDMLSTRNGGTHEISMFYLDIYIYRKYNEHACDFQILQIPFIFQSLLLIFSLAVGLLWHLMYYCTLFWIRFMAM